MPGSSNADTKLLTVGITAHLNSDVNKFRVMLKSLFIPQSRAEWFWNAKKINSFMGLIDNHIKGKFIYDKYTNEHVEAIINIDIRVDENIDVRTDCVCINDVQPTDIVNESFNTSLLTTDQLNKLSVLVSIIYECVFAASRQFTKLCFTINNSSIGRVSRARNNIIRNAHGKFITFCDDDDLSVNTNELALFIAAAEHFRKDNYISIKDANDYFSKNGRFQMKRSRRAPVNNPSHPAYTLIKYPYQYKLNYERLYSTDLLFIEGGLMKCTSNFHSRAPIYTQYYLTNCIVNTEFIRKHSLYFNEGTVGEDSFWRFNIYYKLYLNLVNSERIKVIPQPMYAIYEKTSSTTNKRRDLTNYDEMICSIMNELKQKYKNIPMLMGHFTMCCMLIEKEFRVKYLIRYMLNKNNYESFCFRKHLNQIALHNAERIKNGASMDEYVDVPQKVFNCLRNDHKFDKFSLFMHARLRNKFGVNKMFIDDRNYECNSIMCRINEPTIFLKGVHVGTEIAYDRYIEDCEYIEREFKNVSKECYKCMYVPHMIALWMKQLTLKNVRNVLLDWLNEDDKNDMSASGLSINRFVSTDSDYSWNDETSEYDKDDTETDTVEEITVHKDTVEEVHDHKDTVEETPVPTSISRTNHTHQKVSLIITGAITLIIMLTLIAFGIVHADRTTDVYALEF